MLLLEDLDKSGRPRIQNLKQKPVNASERSQIKAEGNDTPTGYPQDKCLHHLFEEQVALTPEAIAVEFADRTLTYFELNARANRQAHALQTWGVQPGAAVGLLVERSIDMVVALLAILKAGGAYLPLDPANPAERLHTLIAEIRPCLILTQSRFLERFAEVDLSVVCLDQENSLISERDDAPLSLTTPEDLAYVMFTSGSTGRPKGVATPHRSVVRLVKGADFCHFGPEETLLQFAPLAFDASTFEIWGSLLNGGKLVVFAGQTPSLEELGGVIRDRRVTTLWLTAGLFHAMVDHQLESLRGVRQLLAGGEVLSPSHVVRALKGLPGCRLINGYGPTENTTFTCCYTVPTTYDGSTSLPIGRPIRNTQVYILDSHRQPVPAGEVGELYTGGVGLALGYVGQPELTAEKFLCNPFSDQPGARLYRTGDLARTLPDGNIEYLGRLDHQVKIRGFRIELGEIETVLAQHSDVHEAVVLAREDVPGDKRLVAYVTGNSNMPGIGELRAYLNAKLPAYMVPTAFIVLPALPLSRNGKIDRKALPAPDASHSEEAGAFVAPRSGLEETLAKIWQEVLGLERVGIETNFFELGGHSLSATRVVSRIRSAFQVELPLRALFDTPTVAGIAATIAQEMQTSATSGSTGRQDALSTPPPEGTPCPLSFSQQRLWFLDRLVPDSAQYLLPTLLRLEGTLDCGALQQALDTIMARHSVLRTTFHMEGVDPVQVVHPAGKLRIETLDLTEVPAGARAQEAQRRLVKAARRPFDLTQDGMLRATVAQIQPNEHLLLLVVHHIASDGWSEGLFFQELGSLYTAFSQGRSASLPALPLQYADFALQQRQWLRGDRLAQQMDYWRTHLAGAPGLLSLPTDRPRPEQASHAGATVDYALSPALLSRLRTLARAQDATLFMTLLAAFQVLLARYSGQEDIVVGTPIANRTQEAFEGLIGFFVNTLALRGDLSGEPSFVELLGRAREIALGAYAHQDLPFEKLVEELQPERSLRHSPLFQVMFALQNNASAPLDLAGLRTTPLTIDTGSTQFDLTLSVVESEAGLALSLQYATDLFDAATIERLLGHYEVLLEGIVADPQQQISRLPMMDASERHRLLVEWNDTQAAYPQDRCLHQLFEEQVERTPDAIAVVSAEQSLTYRELNVRANRLAHLLQAEGVGPDRLVALCLSRSSRMVVALLAILKAGGAYVALDPAYPAERLHRTLEAAEPTLILTQENLISILPESSIRTLCLESNEAESAVQSEQNPTPSATSSDRAYVLFTSGSTGRPKGVAIAHRSPVALVTWAQSVYSAAELAGVIFSTSLCFDLSVYELFVPLCSGGRVLVVENALAIPAIPNAWNPTLINTVPSAIAELLRRQSVPTTVRTINLAGEALSTALVDALYAQTTVEKVYDLYGPSEDTTYSTWTLREAGGRATIGRPIDNTRCYILDRWGEPVPTRVAGELYIGGAGLAMGYLGQAELTAEKFVSDPFSDQPDARLYRTGDLARYLPDGNIEYLGRLDHQVKIRGFRIELGEIETVLAQHAGVHEAVVLAREDVPGDKRLVAYVTGNCKIPNVKEIREYLESKLPAYMVPSAFVILSTLPLTPNGKIDRKALPAPGTTPSEEAGAFVAPRSGLEETLAKIWQEVLGLEQVSVETNFFELGGHSLLAVRLLTVIKQDCGIVLSLAEMFKAPTVAQMAYLMERKQHGEAAWTTLVPLQPLGNRPPLFCAPVGGGSAFYYRALAKHIGSDQPLYAFEPRGMNGIEAPHRTVEDMASYYIEYMRKVQPHGPYHLCGLSFGGAIAYEIAQQLLAAGEQVGCLILFDTHAPGHDTAWASSTVNGLRRALGAVRYQIGFHLENLAACRALADKIGYMRTCLRNLHKRWKLSEEHLMGMTLPELYGQVNEAEEEARRQYLPQSYPGQVVLLRARLQMPGAKVDPMLGWDKLTTDIQVIKTPGSHFSLLMEPCIHITLQHVRHILAH